MVSCPSLSTFFNNFASRCPPRSPILPQNDEGRRRSKPTGRVVNTQSRNTCENSYVPKNFPHNGRKTKSPRSVWFDGICTYNCICKTSCVSNTCITTYKSIFITICHRGTSPMSNCGIIYSSTSSFLI